MDSEDRQVAAFSKRAVRFSELNMRRLQEAAQVACAESAGCGNIFPSLSTLLFPGRFDWNCAAISGMYAARQFYGKYPACGFGGTRIAPTRQR